MVEFWRELLSFWEDFYCEIPVQVNGHHNYAVLGSIGDLEREWCFLWAITFNSGAKSCNFHQDYSSTELATNSKWVLTDWQRTAYHIDHIVISSRFASCLPNMRNTRNTDIGLEKDHYPTIASSPALTMCLRSFFVQLLQFPRSRFFPVSARRGDC